MSSYPSAYCIKCKAHTDTLGRHTIQLSNNRRALKGVCPVCATETYRFMPAKGDAKRETQFSIISSQRRIASGGDALKYAPSASKEARNPLTRLEHMPVSIADKLIHYGVLLVIFGLAVAIGFVICKIFMK